MLTAKPVASIAHLCHCNCPYLPCFSIAIVSMYVPLPLQMANNALTCTYAAPVNTWEQMHAHQFAIVTTPTINVCMGKTTRLVIRIDGSHLQQTVP